MNHFEQVVGILNGRFPGQFKCRLGTQGQASGLEIRCVDRPGFAFLYEPSRFQASDPSRPDDYLLALHEVDDGEKAECWSTTRPDDVVDHLLPWAFPQEWTPPDPIDRLKEKQRLETLSAGLEARGRLDVRVVDPDPALLALLTDEARRALEQDLASLDPPRIRRHFPWDHLGRLALESSAMLAVYATTKPLTNRRYVSLAAVGPARRRDAQEIRIELAPLFPVNQTHRWQDRPWMWQRVDVPATELLGVPTQDNEESPEQTSLRLLDEGKIEDALALFGVTLSDDLHRLLGGQRILPPACCAHPDAAWTELLVTTLRQSAPWLLARAVPEEVERIRRCTGQKPGARALDWKLAIFPGQFHSRKASLILTADRDGRNPRFLIEATASNARLADTSWKRPIEVDFRRFSEWPEVGPPCPRSR